MVAVYDKLTNCIYHTGAHDFNINGNAEDPFENCKNKINKISTHSYTCYNTPYEKDDSRHEINKKYVNVVEYVNEYNGYYITKLGWCKNLPKIPNPPKTC